MLNLDLELIDIVNNPPSYDELKQIIELSDKNIDCFFNTHGVLYRELKLNKAKLLEMHKDEKILLLSRYGKLLKRPIFLADNRVFVGFDEKEYVANMDF